jgi:hypothetical protein
MVVGVGFFGFVSQRGDWDGTGQGYVVDGQHGCWDEMTESLLLCCFWNAAMWEWIQERERSAMGR